MSAHRSNCHIGHSDKRTDEQSVTYRVLLAKKYKLFHCYSQFVLSNDSRSKQLRVFSLNEDFSKVYREVDQAESRDDTYHAGARTRQAQMIAHARFPS